MRLAIPLLGLSLALATMSADAQSPSMPAPTALPAMISVSAQGEEQVTPDRARISIGVQTQAPTAAEASQRNARLQKAVIDTLRALGIAAEQIGTSGYNVYPEQQFNEQTRRPRIVGYNVQNTVNVEVRRIEQVGAVLDAALSKGANLVSSLSFYSSQGESARRRALARAVANARADAEAMAQAAGGTLGELMELSSGSSYSPPPRPMMEMSAKMAMADVATPIAEGSQTVSALVSARWRFVAGGR